MKRLIHDKDGVYMLDEECLKRKEAQERDKEMQWQRKKEGYKETQGAPSRTEGNTL